jgi:WS/DGAT/MGAT family acyltransferase
MADYDRLTQMDNSFLIFEEQQIGMHVASTSIHEAAPLRRDDGTLDIARIREYVVSRLERIPRYRQRLARTPLENHPVWVDDASFNIEYHVRHSRLPHPGSDRQLKRMIGRIFSQLLDRGKPLWEMWVIEGLAGDRIAVHSKTHHCMVDGVSGSELISELLTPEPIEKVEAPSIWKPRPVPTSFELGAGEVARVARAPLGAGEALWRLARDEGGARHQLGERLRAAQRMLSDSSGTTPTPFNQPVGPYRRVDWMTLPIDRMRAVRRATDCTLNDVVLATTAAAIGRFLGRYRGIDVDGHRFTAMTPVSVRTDEEAGTLGNRVSSWTVELPIAERDPLAALARIHEQTEELKASKQALGAEVLTQVSEWTGSGLLSLGSRLMNLGTPFNMVITNVPGPRTPLYLLDAELLEIHPHVPLIGNLGLGIALFSYAGTLSWGFSADWDLVPDLHDIVLEVERAFGRLCEAAGV